KQSAIPIIHNTKLMLKVKPFQTHSFLNVLSLTAFCALLRIVNNRLRRSIHNSMQMLKSYR
ncbi:hypothetical protein, partial [Latilactobacillus sakei]